jgi:hypothetical protein
MKRYRWKEDWERSLFEEMGTYVYVAQQVGNGGDYGKRREGSSIEVQPTPMRSGGWRPERQVRDVAGGCSS